MTASVTASYSIYLAGRIGQFSNPLPDAIPRDPGGLRSGRQLGHEPLIIHDVPRSGSYPSPTVRYIDRVDAVLLKIEELAKASPDANLIGVGRADLAVALGGSSSQHELRQALHAALQDLELLLCVQADGPFVRLTTQGHQVARVGSLRPGWKSIFNQVRLLPEHVQVLAKAVEIGESEHDGFAVMQMVDIEQVLAVLGQPADRASPLVALQLLDAAGCVGDKQDAHGPPPQFRPYYAGVVVSTEKLATDLQALLARLVEERETTSVDFKELVGLQSPMEKGEFVKDVLAPATTRVSGRRFLSIGFNDAQVHDQC
jgi:hypothetical protein